MKKKIITSVAVLILYSLLSVAYLQVKANARPDPTTLCHTWCYAADYYTCTLHCGDAQGTWDVICYHMYPY
jgi:hypothetical protein